MVTTINEGDQSFFGDYTLNATIEMGATNNKIDKNFQFEGCSFCPGAGAWDLE